MELREFFLKSIIHSTLIFLVCGWFAFALHADQTDPKLDDLFEQLLQTDEESSLRLIEAQIWEIWLQHPNPDVERLMQLGTQRMNAQAVSEAMVVFTQLTINYPNYAEAWNKRATLNYLIGEQEASEADIKKTLELEPRHFGALSGLGLVYLQRNELSKAKAAFEDLIAVHPNSPNAKTNLHLVNEQLRLGVI
ncbi:MAG: tetratricopeptide (TPR) repeat protein [Pseudohongiellaceae bacterium]